MINICLSPNDWKISPNKQKMYKWNMSKFYIIIDKYNYSLNDKHSRPVKKFYL